MALLVLMTYAPGEPIQDFYDKVNAAISTINLAGGGANKGVLMKASGDDFDWTYTVLNLDGGAAFKFPRKASVTDYDYEFVSAIEEVNGVRIGQKKVTLGTWNMNADTTKAVAHGLSATQWKAIRNVTAYIRDDDDTARYTTGRSSADGECDLSVNMIDATNITFARKTSGAFDGTGYNDTGFDRGYMVIEYEI